MVINSHPLYQLSYRGIRRGVIMRGAGECQQALRTVMIESIAALSPFPLSSELKAALVAAYATPARAYHTLEHILDVARHFSRLQWQQPREVFGAVLFHDAIYEVGREDNEQRSAE